MPVLAGLHGVLSAACDKPITSHPTHVYYPGTDGPGRQGGHNPLLHLGGLGPPLQASVAATHGGAVAREVGEQMPWNLRVSLHCTHSALQAPAPPPFKGGARDESVPTEYLESTRNTGMVMGRHEAGAGSAITFFRSAVAPRVAAAQTKALLSNQLSGVYK